MLNATINNSRYADDLGLLKELRADPDLQAALAHLDSPTIRDRKRAYYLARGVRIDAALMPELNKTLRLLRERSGLDDALEAYVVPDQDINAGMTRGAPHALLILHAGAINNLSETELLFVVGHELGHAIYDHIDVHGPGVTQGTAIGPRQRLQLFAWSRAAEISADRVGLLCCGDLDAAISATFKLASGITAPGFSVEPTAFADQWDHYVDEVIDVGSDLFGGILTHPLPHLRMKALTLFSKAGLVEGDASTAGWAARKAEVDTDVDRLLSMLDPLAREAPGSVDPLLADFFLWGGLYVSLAQGTLTDTERDHIASMCSPERLQQALGTDMPSASDCLDQFRQNIRRRKQKLSASEIYRIIDGIAQIAVSDEDFSAAERAAVNDIANELGVNAELIIAEYLN